MKKYLLSTGETTTQVEYYILDLFKLYLTIYPGDIPGNDKIGFDFILTDVKKDELVSEVSLRARSLVSLIKKKFDNYDIILEDISVIDETRVRLDISVNKIYTDNITIDLE